MKKIMIALSFMYSIFCFGDTFNPVNYPAYKSYNTYDRYPSYENFTHTNYYNSTPPGQAALYGPFRPEATYGYSPGMSSPSMYQGLPNTWGSYPGPYNVAPGTSSAYPSSYTSTLATTTPPATRSSYAPPSYNRQPMTQDSFAKPPTPLSSSRLGP